MITNFKVVERKFEGTAHEQWHFELQLDENDYEGFYNDGEVSWFQMQPNPDYHEMTLEALDAEVKKRTTEWMANR